MKKMLLNPLHFSTYGQDKDNCYCNESFVILSGYRYFRLTFFSHHFHISNVCTMPEHRFWF